MFPLTHAFVAFKATQSKDPLLILGSFLPDFAVTKVVNWDETHERGLEFKVFLDEKFPKLSNLAVGFLTHGLKPKGLSYYADYSYAGEGGYAVVHSRGLSSAVARACNLNDVTAKIAATHFVKMAFEVLVARDQPQAVNLVEKSIKESDLKQVSAALAGFYSKDKEAVLDAVNRYVTACNVHDLTTSEGLARTWSVLNEVIFNQKTDEKACAVLIDDTVKTIEPSYKKFLDDSIDAIKKELTAASVLPL